MKHILLIIALFIPVVTFGQHGHSTMETKPAALADGLGDVNHPVSTANGEAQKFFNQGLAYAYAFNHEEAVRSFKRAAELDGNLAMAHWGIALALGSNYNLQADAPQLKEAYANLQKALALAPKASEHERDYINALSKRYSSDPNADRQKLALDYKNAMRELSAKHPDDMDAATLYAESMMNLRPWQLWTADAPFGNSGAAAVLKVADQMLAGKIALARVDKKAAIEILRKAVEAEDATGYNEPSDWDLPARELLGGALLLHNENAEAERIFRAEIAKHPRNGRALFGLVESLKRQNKTSSAQMVEREFEQSWADADTQLRVEDLAGMPLQGEKAATNQTSQRSGEVRLKTGVRIRYVEQGDPNGTPVIMLHGYTDSSVSYSRVLPLMNAKYRVFALDQRGHGDSDRPASGL